MDTIASAFPPFLIRFLTRRDSEKNLFISAAAAVVSGLWLAVGLLSPSAPGALNAFSPEALQLIQKVLFMSFAGNLTLFGLAFVHRDGRGGWTRALPHLLMGWVAFVTVWTAHLLGLMSSVGIAAVPVMGTLAAAVYGLRRAAFWSAVTLAAVFGVGAAEVYGWLPIAPLSLTPIDHAYRNPAVYLPSFVIVAVWTAAGTLLTGSLVEALKFQSRTLTDMNIQLTDLVAMKNRLARSSSVTLRDHLSAAWHLSRSARDILRGMTPPAGSSLTPSSGLTEGFRWADSSLQLAERSLSGSLDEIDRLADAASLEPGHDPLHRSPVSLTATSREIVNAFEGVARVRQVRMEFDGGNGLLVGRYDRHRIYPSIVQIVGSALGHTPPGGRVQVTARTAANPLGGAGEGPFWHEVEVRHTGPGFPADLAVRYGADQPEDAPLPPMIPARQQGLALVSYWMRRHGGRIEIENLEDGCKVRMLLPVELPRAAVVSASAERANEIEELLRARGHSALAIHPDEVRSPDGPGVWMAVTDPDIVVVEIANDPVAAAGLIRAVRSHPETARIPLVAITSGGDDDLLALHEGFDDYIRWTGTDPGALEQRLELFYQRRARD